MLVGGAKVCRPWDLCLYLTAFEGFQGADLDRDSTVSPVPTKFAVSPTFVAVLDSADSQQTQYIQQNQTFRGTYEPSFYWLMDC